MTGAEPVWASLATSLGSLFAILGVELMLLVVAGLAIEPWCRRASDQRWLWRGIVAGALVGFAAEVSGVGALAGQVMRQDSLPAGPAIRPRLTGLEVPSAPQPLRRSRPATAAPDEVTLVSSQRMALGFGAVWLTGSVVLLAILAIAHGLLARVRRRLLPAVDGDAASRIARLSALVGAPGRIRHGVRAGARSPYVFGVFRPTLVLPGTGAERLSTDHQDAVLVHELTHLAVRDPLWQALADVAAAMVWWHPGVWLMRRKLTHAAERAADEATAILPDGPLLLAESLMAWQTGNGSPGWRAGIATLGASRSWLGHRIHHLIQLPPPAGAGRQPSVLNRWVRTSASVAAVMAVMIGPANARPYFGKEQLNMSTSTFFQRSVLGLALLAATEGSSPGQARIAAPVEAPRGVAAAGRTEEAAAYAVGLSDAQVKQFAEFCDEKSNRMVEFRKLPAGADRREAGLAINKWWRAGLQDIMDAEQFSRYLEYWQTNNVVITFDKRDSKKYEVRVAAHPMDTQPALLRNLRLTDDQSAEVDALRTKLARKLDGLQELVASPNGLGDVATGVARIQRERNDGLRSILSAKQYQAYRAALDVIVSTGAPAGRTAVAAPIRR